MNSSVHLADHALQFLSHSLVSFQWGGSAIIIATAEDGAWVSARGTAHRRLNHLSLQFRYFCLIFFSQIFLSISCLFPEIRVSQSSYKRQQRQRRPKHLISAKGRAALERAREGGFLRWL
jgi:hypothetical protein